MPSRSLAPDAYPATESNLEDFGGWSETKAPFVPTIKFSNIQTGEAPGPAMWDVVRVSSDNGEPVVLEDDGSGSAIPISRLVDADTATDADREHYTVDEDSSPFDDV